MCYLKLLVGRVLLFVITAAEKSPPKITFPHGGSLVGTFSTTDYGRIVDTFLGIPYAKPPVNDLRFSPPLPIETWFGEQVVDEDTPPCLQYSIFAPGPNKTIGSEDCLYLNVYRPHDIPVNITLPVLLWYHGGAFRLGSAPSNDAGPHRLLDNDIVLVTCMYRLGALGFLSTGTLDSPGNYGLKDQNMALRWVSENIESFGGDPNKITLAGQSAGGASVAFHLASPLSSGLFHQAIMQSGNSFDPWTLIENDVAIQRTKKLARLFNCSTEGPQDILSCLRDVPGTDITGASPEFVESIYGDPLTVFAPVIEPESQKAFLPSNPRKLQNTYGHRIPIIIGVTSGDGLIKTAQLIYEFNEELSNNLLEDLPLLIGYENIPLDNQLEVTLKLDQFYLGGERGWTSETHPNLTNLFSDGLFFSGLDRFLRNRFATKNYGPTYVYVFDYRGPESSSGFLGGGPDYYGVAHLDDLPFLFNFNQINVTGSVRDRRMRNAMSKMWADFVRTGNPTPNNSFINEKWKRATKYPVNYAKIGNQCRPVEVDGQDQVEPKFNFHRSSNHCRSNKEGFTQECGEHFLIVSNKKGFFERRMKLWRSLERFLERD